MPWFKRTLQSIRSIWKWAHNYEQDATADGIRIFLVDSDHAVSNLETKGLLEYICRDGYKLLFCLLAEIVGDNKLLNV